MNNRSRQDSEREHFDALARAHGETWWGSSTKAGIERLERRARIVKQKLGCYNNPKVFELGCGTGAFSKYMLAELPFLDLTACDISPECAKIASERCGSYKNAKFLVSDAKLDPSYSNAFDVIIGNSVLHHLPVKASLGYCLQFLKHGGCIVFFEPNMLNPQIAAERNIRFIGRMLQNTENETAFFRWGLKKILRFLGFKQISIVPFDFLHPGIPRGLINFSDKIGRKIETIPILKEFSGSLLITAVKP